MSAKESAVADQEPIATLFVLHDKFDLLDFSGPIEAFYHAHHDIKDHSTSAFDVTVAAAEPQVMAAPGIAVRAQISIKEAYARLDEFDMLVVVGGNTLAVLKDNLEPIPIVKAFAKLQTDNPARERTLLSICTGSLFLAQAGLLLGLSATTHSDFLTKLEILCSKAAVAELDDRTDIIDDARYVVNNLRFDLGDEDANPYIRRKSDARRSSNARKGSISRKDSNTRRESITRRAAMRLGGLRVITAGGVASGVDAALYVISALVSEESAVETARILQWTWVKGVVVNGLDV